MILSEILKQFSDASVRKIPEDKTWYEGKKDIVSDREILYNKGSLIASAFFFPEYVRVNQGSNAHMLRKERRGLCKGETFLMKPKVDFCFKELMEDAEIREGFLSALLKIQPEEIKETELLATHLRREHPGDKLGILDIRILVRYWTEKEQSGRKEREQVNLEVQIAPFPLWPERSVFYLAKMYTGQIAKGQDYDALQKCVQVGILDFVLFEEDAEFYSCIHFWEDNRRRMYTDKLEIHILELPKLAQREYPETDLLNWARFFNAEQKEEFEMAAETNPYIEKAYERLADISADEEMRLEYEAREKAIRDHNYLMKTSLELGWKQGMEKGMEEGIEKGIEKGMEQGVRAFIECYREDAFSREKILERLITKFSFTADEAEVYLERYWK